MTVIRAHLVLVPVEQGWSSRRHHCVLSWDSTQPLYTELLFPGPDEVRWRFHRGVWADGLTGRTWGAAGDVMVEPLPDGDLHVWLRGEWSDPDEHDGAEVGEVDYVTSRRLVARFVRDTHEVVGLGREPLPSGDELLVLLLGGAR